MAGAAREEGQLAIDLLEPSALLLALVLKKQVAAIGAERCCAGAAAKTFGAVLDWDGDPQAAAAAGQGPVPLLGGQPMAVGIADVIEDHGHSFPRGGTQGPADHLQVERQAGGGAQQDRATDRWDVGALGNQHAAGEHLHLAAAQACNQAAPQRCWGGATHRSSAETSGSEGTSQLFGVGGGAAKHDRRGRVQPAPVMGDGITDGGAIAKDPGGGLQVELALPFGALAPWDRSYEGFPFGSGPGIDLGPGQPALLYQLGR